MLLNQKYSLKKVNVNGLWWQYYDIGHGKKTLVIFPNILVFPEEWFAYGKSLGKKYRLIIPLYPHVSDYQMMVEQLHNFLYYLEIKKFILLGNSVGGIFAQGYASKYPRQVEQLILLATIGPQKSYGLLVAILYVIGILSPRVFVNWFVYLGTKISLTKQNGNKSIEQRLKKHIFQEKTKDSLLSLGRCIVSFSFGSQKKVTSDIPLTIVDAKKDSVFPYLFQNLSTVYSGANYYKLEGAKHLVEINKKAKVMSLMQNID